MDVLLATQKTVTTECPDCSDGSIELAVLIPARATDAEPRYEWSSDACPACGGSGWVTVIACVACGLSVGECSCDEGVLEAWLAGGGRRSRRSMRTTTRRPPTREERAPDGPDA